MNEEFREAAIYGDIDTVEDLLKKDSSLILEKDEYGFTVLHDVAGEDQIEMLNLLIDAGANVNAQNEDGIAPLHLAAYNYIAETLLKAGAILELKTINGETPLYIHSTEEEGEEVMEFLLEAGANPVEGNNQGETPLDVAVSREEPDKVALFKKYAN